MPGGDSLGKDQPLLMGNLRVSAVRLTEVELTEDQLDGKHIVISCSLSFGDIRVQTHALIDCGASGYAFRGEGFARQYQIPQIQLKKPRIVEVINGSPISSGDITHLARATLSIQEHHENLPMFISALGHYPILLGIQWLCPHDVGIRFASDILTFGSQYCLAHCTEFLTTIKAMEQDPPECNHSPPLQKPHQATRKETLEEAFPRPIKINLIGVVPFIRKIRNDTSQVLSLSLNEINKALDREAIKGVDLKTAIPEEYQDILPLFDEVIARELPPH